MNRAVRWVVVGIGVCGLMLGGRARVGAEPPTAPTANERTIQGEVVDPATYLKEGRHGSEQAPQTDEAVNGGQSLAILDDATDMLYLLLAAEPGEDPNELVYDYLNQQVKATGAIYERAGVRGIVPTSVTPVESNPKAAPTPPQEPDSEDQAPR